MKRQPVSSGPCCQSWSVALRLQRAGLIAWCCSYGVVGSLFNVLHHTRISGLPFFGAAPKGPFSLFLSQQTTRLLEI